MALDVFHWLGQVNPSQRLYNGYRRCFGSLVAGNTALIQMPQSIREWFGAQTLLVYNLVTGQSITVYKTLDDMTFCKASNFATFNWVQIGSALTLAGSLALPMPMTGLRIDTTGGASAGFAELVA